MKIALVTTTINIPTILELHRDLSWKGISAFVAGDEKTPKETETYCYDVGAVYLSPTTQHYLGYGCSDFIGWNCIQRRNIATLEALKWGAEHIIMFDDDNIARCLSFLSSTLSIPFSGFQAWSDRGWFDAGQLLLPKARHRGFPFKDGEICLKHIVGAKIGVAAGVCIGDPDVDATFRMEHAPEVHVVSEVLREGVVVAPKHMRTVFNSQNTAFVRELAPAMFMIPGIGRYDDIVASLITQRVMEQTGHVVHFGQPFAWQQRNAHDLVKDLENELWGMKNLWKVHEVLQGYYLPTGTGVIEQVRQLYRALRGVLPNISVEAGLSWCEDCERVM